MNRREWVIKSSLSVGAFLTANSFVKGFQKSLSFSSSHIILVSGWQTVNIGNIAHTPGLIHLLKTHFPDLDQYLKQYKSN